MKKTEINKKRNKLKIRNYALISLSVLSVVLYLIWNNNSKSLYQRANINEISSIQGTVEIVGLLQKDSPLGVVGQYLLITSDGNIFIIKLDGLDQMVGSNVIARGIIREPDSSTANKNALELQSIEVLK